MQQKDLADKNEIIIKRKTLISLPFHSKLLLLFEQNTSEAERQSSSKVVGVSTTGSPYRPQCTKSGTQEGANEKLQQSPEEKQQSCTEPNNSDNLNRQNSITASQCWNFPRVKLRKLFTAKSLDDILGGGRSRSASEGSQSALLARGGRKKSLQVAGVSSFAQQEISGERSSSSPEFIIKSTTTTNTKKAQLLRGNVNHIKYIIGIRNSVFVELFNCLQRIRIHSKAEQKH